ncbi:hypothetical protein [Lactobacillus ultunensis]|nr:hypothetical protein [Lactobacillus ultunensis]QQP28302.1 hypothetical protein H4B44_09440 [Lactobacillus ultunensis]
MNISFLTDSTFWTAVSAIGTLLAVIVSLYIANHPKKKTKIIVRNIYIIPTIYGKSSDTFQVIITVLNLGDLPIIIYQCGILGSNNSLETTYNKYIVTQNYAGKIIKAGDAAEIKYNFGNSFNNDNPYGYNQIFTKGARFAIRDTTNNIYFTA